MNYTSKLIKSTDGGNTWNVVPTPFFDAPNGDGLTIEISRTNPNIIYVTTYNMLYYSSDGGTSWTAIPAPEFPNGRINAIILDQNNLNRIYLAVENTVYRSLNGGNTWAQVGDTIEVNDPDNSQLSDIAVDSSINKTIYALKWDRLWKLDPSESVLNVEKTGNGSGTIISGPTGVSCGDTCSGIYSIGTEVTLLAFPASNSEFIGWEGACSGRGFCKITMNQSAIVSAKFTIRDPSMTSSSSLSLFQVPLLRKKK